MLYYYFVVFPSNNASHSEEIRTNTVLCKILIQSTLLEYINCQQQQSMSAAKKKKKDIVHISLWIIIVFTQSLRGWETVVSSTAVDCLAHAPIPSLCIITVVRTLLLLCIKCQHNKRMSKSVHSLQLSTSNGFAAASARRPPCTICTVHSIHTKLERNVLRDHRSFKIGFVYCSSGAVRRYIYKHSKCDYYIDGKKKSYSTLCVSSTTSLGN